MTKIEALQQWNELCATQKVTDEKILKLFKAPPSKFAEQLTLKMLRELNERMNETHNNMNDVKRVLEKQWPGITTGTLPKNTKFVYIFGSYWAIFGTGSSILMEDRCIPYNGFL